MDVTTTKTTIISNEKKSKKKSITSNPLAAAVAVESIDPINNIVTTPTSTTTTTTTCKKEKKKAKKKNKSKSITTGNCNHLQPSDQEKIFDNDTRTDKTITLNGMVSLNGDNESNTNNCHHHKNENGEINCRVNESEANDEDNDFNCANFDASLKTVKKDENHLNGDDKDDDGGGGDNSITDDNNVNNISNGKTILYSEENANKLLQLHEHEPKQLIDSNTTTTNEQQLCNILSATIITDNSNSKIESTTTTTLDDTANSQQHNNELLSMASETNDCRSNIIIEYKEYENELQMPDIMRLIQKDLSEPYSIYTYRYFIHKWPKLCFLAMHGNICVGAIVCKLDIHRSVIKRGYIAMLAVDQDYRKLKIGTNLVRKAIEVIKYKSENNRNSCKNFQYFFFVIRQCLCIVPMKLYWKLN